MIPADKQTAFNRVWNHLRTQRKQALDNWGLCQYLAPDGSKCAIGIFIKDGDEAQGSKSSVYGLDPDLFEDRSMGHQLFLYDLQRAHDAADRQRPRFRQRLIEVANKYGLTYPKRGWAPGPR